MFKTSIELEDLRNSLRSQQQVMADWQGGEMAVSAVPGAGKSTGMAVLAAIAIAKHHLNRQHQLIIVTFTRSAALNIRQKIVANLQKLHLPHSAFITNTLHGLAFSIASSHRELAGFSVDDTQIISESQKTRLIRQAVTDWIRANPKEYERLWQGRSFDGEDTERLRRQTVLRTDILPNLAKEVIATAKSSQLLPIDLRHAEGEILEVGAGIYETYNKLLKAEGAIDYDDMILGALRVLENPSVRQYWQERVFAVFEDEAQDSSPLQTQLLEKLAQGDRTRNLVRVGDPNQAINSSFTNADPRFFNSFCDRAANQHQLVEIKQAGRSAPIIINAANFVLAWVNQSFYQDKSEKPFRMQSIQPVDLGDIQPNPNPLGKGLEIEFPPNIQETAARIKQRIIELFQFDPNLSMAVLVRQHNQGKFINDALQPLVKSHELKIYDVEQRDRRSRVPAEMLAILQFIDRPHSPDYLKAALTVLFERQKIKPQDLNALASTPEQFLYPTVLDPELTTLAKTAQHICIGLLKAKLELPVYNLIAFIAFTLDYDQGELATADKLSARLRQQLVSDYTMSTMISALQEIVITENFEAVEEENLEGRYMQSGQVTIISLHKAKGLDWDVVFMPFLDERTCPGKPYIPESVKFLGDFTLSEVARAQMRSLIHHEVMPNPDTAWQKAQTLKQAEEFRLLYVGMTRAKRLLYLSTCSTVPFSWNNLDSKTEVLPCPAIAALNLVS